MLSIAAMFWGCLFALGLVGAIGATSVNAIRKLVRSKSMGSPAGESASLSLRRESE